MLNCYYGNISVLCPPWEDYPISKERQKRLERYAHTLDKARSAGAELLLNYGLKHQFKEFVPPAEFGTGEHGKPFLKPNQTGILQPEGETLHYNLSHSADYAACAISDRPAGIDIEKKRDTIRPGVMRFFSEEERQIIEKSKQPDRAFFDVWVLKESYMKAVGTGFAKSPSSFSVRLEKGRYWIYEQGVRQAYECFLFHPKEGYHLAVCTEVSAKTEVPVLEEVLWQ